MTYTFAAFRLDPAERLLLREGTVSLTPKAFDLLVYLVEHHGRLVEKATLMAALWPDTIVEEANLAFQVSALRKALGDGGAKGSLIQTVPTKGYRFVAEVTRGAADSAAAGVARPVESPSATTPSRRSFHPLARPVALGLLALLLVAAAGGYLLGRPDLLWAPRTSLPPLPPMRLLPVTTLTGWQDWPSLSPDGEQVAFEWAGDRDSSGGVLSFQNHDIYVTLVGSRDVRRLTTHPAEDFAPSWSPDGKEIAFLRTESGATRIHVMSALGGSDRTISDFPAWSALRWSPDARFIAAGRMADRDEDRGIYLVPVSGGPPRAIERLRAPKEAHAPAFSPDGRRLSYAQCETFVTEGDSNDCHVMLVDIDDAYAARAEPRRLTADAMSSVGALAWSRDGSSIVFDGPGQLWRISPDDPHAPERIEIAGSGVQNVTTSMSRDRLVFSRGERDLDGFRLVRGRQPERVVTSAAFDGHSQFSPDGRRIAFYSERTGTGEILGCRSHGSSERQVTRGLATTPGSPRWSPDGSLIAFDAQGHGATHIWTIPAEGGTPRQLTKEAGAQTTPTWSHDGQWIYFTQHGGGQRNVWRVRSTGGPIRADLAGG